MLKMPDDGIKNLFEARQHAFHLLQDNKARPFLPDVLQAVDTRHSPGVVEPTTFASQAPRLAGIACGVNVALYSFIPNGDVRVEEGWMTMQCREILSHVPFLFARKHALCRQPQLLVAFLVRAQPAAIRTGPDDIWQSGLGPRVCFEPGG